MSDIRQYIQLIESHERVDESFSDAKTKFYNDGDETEVDAAIDKFKQLVKNNIIKGNDRDIGKWIKSGWEKFKKFVDDAQHSTSTSNIKNSKSKNAGEYITLHDDGNWLIVIPLDKDASCFHGKNTDWCTAKSSRAHFEEYFLNKSILLIYLISNSGKYAIAATDEKSYELFNQQDESINADQFKQATSYNPSSVIRDALKHSDRLSGARQKHFKVINDLSVMISELDDNTRSNIIEKYIIKTQSKIELMNYLNVVGKHDFPPAFEYHAINLLASNDSRHFRDYINYFDNLKSKSIKLILTEVNTTFIIESIIPNNYSNHDQLFNTFIREKIMYSYLENNEMIRLLFHSDKYKHLLDDNNFKNIIPDIIQAGVDTTPKQITDVPKRYWDEDLMYIFVNSLTMKQYPVLKAVKALVNNLIDNDDQETLTRIGIDIEDEGYIAKYIDRMIED